MNLQAYAQAYINRLFQTLSTTLGSHLLGRAAQKKNLPLLPELLGRTAQGPAKDRNRLPPATTPRRPDTCINVEAAALPEPAALQRDDPPPSREVPTDLTRPAQRLARKGAVNALQRYTAQPTLTSTGRWCII